MKVILLLSWVLVFVIFGGCIGFFLSFDSWIGNFAAIALAMVGSYFLEPLTKRLSQ